MSISPGAQLGAFSVLGLLGQGGMGKVYRARDNRLKREVALKVLPDALATDPERVARFQREAEILASLAHQNIAAVYGLEESSGVRALVMELVEGPTLADRIAGGAIPVEDALQIAQQLADALDYAHENGVLHRDLKPANIKVTPDGQVKVLDFGLAKAIGAPSAAGAEASPDHSPTITSPAFTRAGTILGTAAYMAPEQIRGRALDKRADIWAFGCVLYEMLTGARAFDGESVSDTLAEVLKNDPDWTRVPPSVPASLTQLLRHCLVRDPKGRLRDIADARFLLQSVSPAPVPVQARRRWLDVVLGAALATGLVAAGWYATGPQRSSGAGPVRRVTVQLPAVFSTSTTGGGSSLAIAPDGSAIAFAARSAGQSNQLFVHRFSDATTTMVRVPTAASFPVFSRDSRSVAFTGGGRVWRTLLDGGEAEALCATGALGNLRGTAWTDEGRVVIATNSGLLEASQPGGACPVVLETEGSSEARFLWPQVLPGGRGTLLTVSGVSDDADSASVVVVPAGSTERRVIVRAARAGRLTASGHLLFARGDQIFAAPFDLARLTITADPVVVLDGVASGQFSAPLLGVSDLGDLVFVPGQDISNRLVWVTRDGTRTDAGAPRRHYQPEPRLSPDGRRLAVSIGTGDHFLWLFALATGTLTPLVSGRDTHGAVWSPDGRKVAFPSYGSGIAVKDLEATAEPAVVLEAPGLPSPTPETWSLDGSTIVIDRPSPGGSELAALDLATGTTRTLLRSSAAPGAQISPDGHWLAYTSSESGRLEVYVTDFPSAQVKKPVSTDGGSAPVWARSGRELFYVSGTSMMAAAVNPGPSIEFGRPVRLFGGIQFATAATPFSVAPDGRFLLVEEAEGTETDRSQLTLVLNWFEELRRLVPHR